jgi:GcrA cell cycle regulator
MSFQWDNENIEKLKARHTDGLSAAKIGKEFGITRNSVLGKLFRLGLSSPNGLRGNDKAKFEGRHSTMGTAAGPMMRDIKRKLQQQHANAGAPCAETVTDVPCDLPPEQSLYALPLMRAREDSCRWPLDEPSHEMTVCGAPRIAKRPYCARHCKTAYQPARR